MDKVSRDIISGTRFDFSAVNFCGAGRYPLSPSDRLTIDRIESAIPDNIFDLNREQLAPIVKAIMHEMNVAWSSTGGIPTFPEKFGDETRLGIRPHSIYMSGRGWAFTLYRQRYSDFQPGYAKAMKEIIDSTSLTDDEKSDKLLELVGPIATPIG